MSAQDYPAIALNWIVVVASGGLTIFVLYLLFRYREELSDMLQEANGKGSISRFQMLFFTLTIGGSYVAQVIGKGTATLDANALALLGISGGSYVLSKGISAGSDLGKDPSQAQTPPTTVVVKAPVS